MLDNIGTQFIWWVGVVENRQDPLKVGRCQVRIVGSHTEQKAVMPTADLPWAHPLIPLNDSASLQIKEGDYVVGFYLDGRESQKPVIMGILPGIPVQLQNPTIGFVDPREGSALSSAPKVPKSLTINSSGDGVQITEGDPVRYPARLNEPTFSRLARNEQISSTAIQSKKDSVFRSLPKAGGGTFDEPSTPYAAVYPYNRVMETESGHIVEFDDTPGAERIHIYHRSGSSEEYHPNGDRVSRINADAYEIVLADKHIYVNGDVNITAKNSVNLKAGEHINIEAGGDVRIKAKGAFKSQSLEDQIHYSYGGMTLRGIPLNLNGPAKPPLGDPGLPIEVLVEATTPIAAIPPDATVPGNQTLAQRPGANVSEAKPNELAPPVDTPTDIPTPAVAQTEPVIAITSNEGADVMIRAMNRARLTNATQRAAIYAQAQHESANFQRMYESFKYTREGLLTKWTKYFTTDNVSEYLRRDEKIASRVYGNRMGNSTEESLEGWTYRGRGFIQLTGKSNYLKAARDFNQDFVSFPDAVAVPDMSADIAVWYFVKGRTGRGYSGNYDDVTSVTKYVNGGTNGLESRQEYYAKAKTNVLVTTYNSGLV